MDNKLNINKEMPSDEEIEKYMDLQGLMQRHETKQKIAFMALVLLSVKRHSRQITIMSVIILFTALSVFAFIKFNKKNNEVKPETKGKGQGTKLSVLDTKEKFYTQTLLLGVNQDMLIKGGLGSKFLVHAGSFIHLDGQIVKDTIRLNVIEIIDKEVIRENNFSIAYKGKTYQPDKVYFLSAAKGDFNLKVNEGIPLEIVIADSAVNKFKVFYGVEKQGKFSWSFYNYDKGMRLEDPSTSMLEFQRYEDSKRLLDSLKLYYYLQDNQYKPTAKRGMVYKKDFVTEVALFVHKYQETSDFNIKVNKATHDWEKYNKARKILINVSGNTSKQATLKIYRSGWFALVRID